MGYYKKIRSHKERTRLRRRRVIRKRVHGTAERPRLSVFRSNAHIYAQAIDDVNNTVLASASDLQKDSVGSGKKVERAKAIGAAVGQKLLEKSVKQVVFDRNGFVYHGRVKAVAEGAREAGLEF